MIEWATDLVAGGGLFGVFALMVAENLFPPIPSEVIMPLAGFAAAEGRLSLPGVIVAGTVGAVLGNAVWFELARVVGAERVYRLADRFGRWVGIGRAELERAAGALRRNGALAVFLGRFMPGIRTAISIPAGLVGISRGAFYLWTTLGSAIWTAGLALGGFWLGEHYEQVAGYAGPIGLAVLGVVVAGLAVHVWRAARAR